MKKQENEMIRVVQIVEKEQLETEHNLPAIFNRCDHIVINMPETEMGTVVLTTPFGVITVCTMPFSEHGTGCLDIKLHTPDKTTRMIGFMNGRSQELKHHDLYSLDVKNKPAE